MTRLAERIGKLGLEVRDLGDVDAPLPEECEPGDPKKKYAREIRQVCDVLADRVHASFREGRLPVVLGGDHTVAMGSVAGAARWFRESGSREVLKSGSRGVVKSRSPKSKVQRPLGVIWFDAHGDMNTPQSTVSGNVHGMPLAALLGLGTPDLTETGGFAKKIAAAHTALVGIRNLDDRERKLIADSGVTVFTMKDIDRQGISQVVEDAIDIASRGTAGIHVSFDMDAVDPTVAPGVGTPVKGGLSYRESHLAMELVAESKKLTSFDLVEINPIHDTRNSTAEFGAELILSALGKVIF